MAGVVYISEEEAERDFRVIMKHIRSGDEVRLDCKDGVTAVVKRAGGHRPLETRSIPAISEERQAAAGELSIFDDEFFTEVAEAYQSRTLPQKPAFQSRTIAEAIEILRLREQTQPLAVPDPDMASDMEEIHALYNQPMDMSRWD